MQENLLLDKDRVEQYEAIPQTVFQLGAFTCLSICTNLVIKASLTFLKAYRSRDAPTV